MVGMVLERVEDDGRRPAKAGEVDAGDGVLLGEAWEHEVEDRQLGKERVDEEEMRSRAALVVFDLGGAYFDEGQGEI